MVDDCDYSKLIKTQLFGKNWFRRWLKKKNMQTEENKWAEQWTGSDARLQQISQPTCLFIPEPQALRTCQIDVLYSVSFCYALSSPCSTEQQQKPILINLGVTLPFCNLIKQFKGEAWIPKICWEKRKAFLSISNLSSVCISLFPLFSR